MGHTIEQTTEVPSDEARLQRLIGRLAQAPRPRCDALCRSDHLRCTQPAAWHIAVMCEQHGPRQKQICETHYAQYCVGLGFNCAYDRTQLNVLWVEPIG